MAVPYTFANATTSIPLSQLDSNFATAITIGNTAVYLGNTTTSFGNVTLTNVTISSGNSTVTKETVTTITSPAATALTIQSANTTAMTIDTSQNVGIGTSSPGALLELSATNANVYSAIRLTNTTGTGTTAGAGIEWARAGTVKSSITANTFGNDYMAFNVNGNTERMRIDTSGNVGIGTTSPSQKLQVASGNIYISTTNYLMWDSSGNYGLQSDGSSRLSFFAGGGTERMRIDSSGRVLVNSTSVLGSGSGRLQAYGVSGSYVGASFYMNNNGNDDWLEFTQPSGISGRISKVGGVFTLVTVSDQRVKKDITDAPSCIDKLNSLKVREFLMDDQEERTIGLVAQEAINVMPEIVKIPKNPEVEYYTVAYGNLVPYLLKAIQELKADFDAYKASHP